MKHQLGGKKKRSPKRSPLQNKAKAVPGSSPNSFFKKRSTAEGGEVDPLNSGNLESSQSMSLQKQSLTASGADNVFDPLGFGKQGGGANQLAPPSFLMNQAAPEPKASPPLTSGLFSKRQEDKSNERSAGTSLMDLPPPPGAN